MYNVLSCEHTVKYSLWRIIPHEKHLSSHDPGPAKTSVFAGGCRPRGDKFLISFILRFFSIVIPAQAGIHCAAGICVAFATALFTWVPVSSTGMTHFSFFLNKLQNEKQPQNKLITTKLQNKKTQKPVIPAQAGIHCAAGICVVFATTLFTWAPVSSTGVTHFSFFS